MADTFAPNWDLLINGGKKLSAMHRAAIDTITFDADTHGSDEIIITASAWDTFGRRFLFVGEGLLAPGNYVVLYLGYGVDLVAVQRFKMLVEKTNYRGQATVTMHGYSAEHRLAEFNEARAWEGPISDSDIVRELADAHGLTYTDDTVETTAERDQGRTKAKGTSDLEFLHQLAVANNYGAPTVLYDEGTDSDVMWFRTTTLDPENEITFTWNPAIAESDLRSGDLSSFDPTLDLHGVPTIVEVSGWDTDAQVAVVVRMSIADVGQDPLILLGEAVDAAGYEIQSGSGMQAKALAEGDDPASDKIESFSVPHITNVDQAVAWATAWITTRNQAFLTARSAGPGVAKLYPGQIHTVEGVAPVHVGRWECLGARHTISSSGYQSRADWGRVLEGAPAPAEV